MKQKSAPIWCDHCNTEINVAGVRSCLRKTCESKALLPDVRRVWK
jgi:hypothetical protein